MITPLVELVEHGGETIEVPHWCFRVPQDLWGLYEHFPDFLVHTWRHLNLPPPTRAQLEIAHRLQYGYDTAEAETLPDDVKRLRKERHREDIIRAFRAIGKSYITAAFVVWRVARNPRDEKVLVVSASSSKSTQFVAQVKGLVSSMPVVQWMLEGDRQRGATRRDRSDAFDVTDASNSQSHSISAMGITSQITGSRATMIVADDIEVEKNSLTQVARERILNSIRSDFVMIVKTEQGRGDIFLLGTPQTEESVYNSAVTEMGFTCMTIPVRFPTPEKIPNYVLKTSDGGTINILAPYLLAMHEAGELDSWEPTDSRFSEDELLGIEAKGAGAFALQMQLDTSLSDAERYPLKLRDLIIFPVNERLAPRHVAWGRDSDKGNVIKLPHYGFSDDFLLGPLFADKQFEPYDAIITYVDPAGRGKDETAWATVGSLAGTLYLIELSGEKGDPAVAMERIAKDVVRIGVGKVIVEPNYGQGMWSVAFEPILARVLESATKANPLREITRIGVEESTWAKGQKERRIIDTLEPVMVSHRLVVNEAIIRSDLRMGDRDFSLMYQLTRITQDRGSLRHDDRIDALAGAVAFFLRSMRLDSRVEAEERDKEAQEELIESFLEAAGGGDTLFSGRGLRIDGFDTETWGRPLK